MKTQIKKTTVNKNKEKFLPKNNNILIENEKKKMSTLTDAKTDVNERKSDNDENSKII